MIMKSKKLILLRTRYTERLKKRKIFILNYYTDVSINGGVSRITLDDFKKIRVTERMNCRGNSKYYCNFNINFWCLFRWTLTIIDSEQLFNRINLFVVI